MQTLLKVIKTSKYINRQDKQITTAATFNEVKNHLLLDTLHVYTHTEDGYH